LLSGLAWKTQDAPAPTAPAPVSGATKETPADFLKQSTKPVRILVIGSSDFGTDGALQGSPENAALISNAVGSMTAEGLSTLVVNKFSERTPETRYELAAETVRVLEGLDTDLRVTVYLTRSSAPAAFDRIRDVECTVRAFERNAKRHLAVEFVDPGKSAKAQAAAASAGFQPIMLQVGEAGGITVLKFYSGIVIEAGGRSEKVYTVMSTGTLEYDLARRIARLASRRSARIAWSAVGPPSADAHAPSTDLAAADALLKEEYETTTLDLRSQVPDDVQVLLLCNAERLSNVQLYRIDQFLMRGGGMVVMAYGSVPRAGAGADGKPSPMQREGSDRLPDDFFSHYGFRIDRDVVLDLSCMRVPYKKKVTIYPPFVQATKENIDSTRPISANLGSLAFTWPSSITLVPKSGVSATELVKSSAQSKRLDGAMVLEPDALLPKSEGAIESWKKEFAHQYALAVLLEGRFESYFVTHPIPAEIGADSGAKTSK
jgi:ABC-type uncharacterized transport system involved in gliding motility auxiliary subunit